MDTGNDGEKELPTSQFHISILYLTQGHPKSLLCLIVTSKLVVYRQLVLDTGSLPRSVLLNSQFLCFGSLQRTKILEYKIYSCNTSSSPESPTTTKSIPLVFIRNDSSLQTRRRGRRTTITHNEISFTPLPEQ